MKVKFFLFFLAVTCLLGSVPTHALSVPFNTNNGSEPSDENKTLLHTLSALQDQKQELLADEIELRQLEEKGAPDRFEVDSLEKQIAAADAELKQLQESATPDAAALKAKEDQLAKLKTSLEEARHRYEEATAIYDQQATLLKEQITEIETDIAKLRELAERQALSFASRLFFFFSLVILLLIARFVVAKMIRRLSGKIPAPREQALYRLNKIFFGVLVGLTILAGVFSQLISFLPFLAILGTALAFALRDIISSFIAWFIIGTDQGYRIGDLIQTGKLRGRVLEVHPLLTVIRQTGLRGDTGRIVSFPNKYIFEQEVQNFSKLYRFIYIMLDFILAHDSDIDAAKRALRETILEVIAKDHDEAEKKLPGLQRHFSFSAGNIEPQIFIEPDPRGILLRGKYFVRLENRHRSRSEITESFLRKVQKMDNINLRLVEFGEESQKLAAENPMGI